MVEWKEDVRLKNWGRKLVGAWRDTRGQVNALGDRDARSFARIYARVRVRRTNPGKLRKDTTIDSETTRQVYCEIRSRPREAAFRRAPFHS